MRGGGNSARGLAWFASALALVGDDAGAAPTEPEELTHPLATSESCRTCHLFPNPDDRSDEPQWTPYLWQGSMMANAARDPVFWAGVAIASQDDPAETVACVRCHAPRAFLEGRGDATAIEQLEPDDLDGISCDLCHRMVDDGVTPAGNAMYTIDDQGEPGAMVAKRGPWSYDVAHEHEWIQGGILAEARACGTCHDVSTPRERVDEDGVSMGVPFNEQRTYSEWLGSAFAVAGADFRSCQDCHMPAIDDAAGCAAFVDGMRHATGARRHELVGANRFMVGLLRDLYGSAGSGELFDQSFDATLERMDELIATAATLEIEAPAAIDLGAGTTIGVRVENQTGHKLPTGYSEGRVMWLEVVVRHGAQVLWSSGLRGDDGTFEQDGQLRTYRALAEDADDHTTLHLLRNNRWIEDTRIPPRGLRPDPQTDPVGDRYVVQDDGSWPHWDQLEYAFASRDDVADDTPGVDDEAEISVSLLYLVNTPEYIEFLADENVSNDAGTRVAELFADRGGAPAIVLAHESIVVPLTGLQAGDTTGGTETQGTTGTDTTATDDSTTSTSTSTTTPGTDESTSGAASETTGTGETGTANDPSGCGCDSHRGPTRSAWAPLAALVAGMGPRRRRRVRPGP